MGIPVNALKDDELLHYAGLDPDVAAEFTRRVANGSIDPGAETESLRDEIRGIESTLDDQHEEIENLQLFMSQAVAIIRQAMKPETPQGEVRDLLIRAIGKLE